MAKQMLGNRLEETTIAHLKELAIRFCEKPGQIVDRLVEEKYKQIQEATHKKSVVK